MRTPGWFAIGAFVPALFLTVVAQGRTANDGVYTESQATKGEQIYYAQCANCHGDTLAGMGASPPLAGTDFLANWQDRTVGDLFTKNHETMPATAPGTLTTEQAAAVTAFLLWWSKFPAGQSALAAQVETLRQIKVGRPVRRTP